MEAGEAEARVRVRGAVASMIWGEVGDGGLVTVASSLLLAPSGLQQS